LPSKLLTFTHLQLALPLQHFVKVQLHQRMGVVNALGLPSGTTNHLNAQFLAKFSRKGLLDGFALLNFAAWKLPVTGIGFSFGTGGQ